AWCQSCDPFKTTQGWTSGNNDIDDCIREFQLKCTRYEDVIEWIPFNRLSNLHKIGLIFQALWLDGIRKVENNTQSRTLSYSVKIKKFNNSEMNELEFIKEFKNYMELKDSKLKLYGITQDTANRYMIVFDDSYYKRNNIHGKCAQCEMYNTTKAWCQSCDPFETTRGWTSRNIDIDNRIKEYQLKNTEYENVIEWIPFNRLSNLQKIDEFRFYALWLDGIRIVKNNSQSRILSCAVGLEFYSHNDILDLIQSRIIQKSSIIGRKIFGITRDTTTDQYMIVFDEFYYRRDIVYGKCKQCKRHNTSKAWCQSCDPFKTTQGWTSENNDIDDCIKEFQLKCTRHEDVIEWIPFNRLSDLQKIGLNFQALWLDGIRIVENNTQSRILPYAVEIKKFGNSQIDTLEFIKEFKNYMQLRDKKQKIFGITQNTTSEYLIVCDDFFYKRNIQYGRCKHCNRYNTSESWCLSCDSFKATQKWTSKIKEIQLKSTRYENVIEWIPFNRLSYLQKMGSNFQALWLDGIRFGKNDIRSHTLSFAVELKRISISQINTLRCIKEFKNYVQLRDNERKIFLLTWDENTNQCMIVFDEFYYRRGIVYGICTQCKRHNTSEAWCLSCDPFNTTQGWTSGNNDIDVFIKEAQLKCTRYEDVIEWIPFNRLSSLRRTGVNFQALWLDGIRNVRNNTRLRLLSHAVELKKFNDSQINTSEFIKNLKNYLQFKDNECKLYGITQDTRTGQYMIVFDDFYYRRGFAVGKCKQCKRNNTSEAWCLSCDPIKTTQGWTSGNMDIDYFIKELQLKSTRYENVIEWIPFNKLFNLQKIGESKFLALLTGGIRQVQNNSQSRTLSCAIKLEKFDYSHIDTLNFIEKFKKYINNESKLYGITQDTTTGQYMIAFDDFYYKINVIYGKCICCERYNTSEAWCQSCDLFKTIQGWTSGNNDIDECIKEFQLKTTKYEDVIEWIPFYKLSKLQKIGELEFKAQWLAGIRKVESCKLLYSQDNTLKFIQTRTLSHAVELKKFADSQIDALEFIKKDSKLRLYGITKDTTTNQYMIVFDGFYHGRDIIYERCAHCNRYNTSEAWCQSCDPFKEIQVWTSGSKDIDNYIKGLQLKVQDMKMLSNLQKIEKSKFYALWLDGIRKVKNNTQLRTLPCLVELQKFDGLQTDALEFIIKFKSFVQFEINGHRIFGITQNASSKQYMAVIDYCISKRDEKYGVCRWDEHYNTSRGWCQSCDPFEMTQAWTSESIDVDDCIKEFQLIATEYDKVIEWIPFDRLNNIQQIGKGGFGDVFFANWIDGKRKVLKDGKGFIQSRTQSYLVALKTLSSSSNSMDFLKEFKNHMRCRLMGSSLEIYGLTKNTTTNQYMIVLQYANNGDLRQYLETNFKELTWKDKLSRLMDISKDLSLIHEAKYIHCDLHSGNIVLHKEGSWLERSKTYIIDLGLSRKNEGTPEFYVEFSELCMNFDPQKRPTAEEIFHKLEEWYNLINEFDETENYDDTQELDRFEFDEIDEIDESKVEMFNKFIESDEIVKRLPMAMKIHQDSEYTRKFINTDVISERYWKDSKIIDLKIKS
ncbi:570_t:CDS:10, partial [Acaulospora morrowiae]